ncbi:hypothetical protein CYMTET_14193 [Cymbomonas tetramitiformis]|uniref:Glycosyltransferase n=1 Tax=Cymbomonas tetramitiformis TaxID=36881 RepID=A0AAE0GGK3_9CHLO|nr:hypothetical protein CYMTET_14193 [Cymbomonas tetramitiformis]
MTLRLENASHGAERPERYTSACLDRDPAAIRSRNLDMASAGPICPYPCFPRVPPGVTPSPTFVSTPGEAPAASPLALQTSAPPLAQAPAASPLALQTSAPPLAQAPAASPLALQTSAPPLAQAPAASPLALQTSAPPEAQAPAASPLALQTSAPPLAQAPAASPLALHTSAPSEALNSTLPSTVIAIEGLEASPPPTLHPAQRASESPSGGGTLREGLRPTLQAAAEGNTILLTFGTGSYMPLVLNLLASLKRVDAGLAKSFCFLALDDVALQSFQHPTRGGTCLLDGVKLFGQAIHEGTGLHASETPVKFAAAGVWNKLMLFRWRVLHEALALGFNVTVLDSDIAFLRDPRPVFEEYMRREPTPDVIMYCCNNVGLMHFPAAAKERTQPFLEAFISNLTNGSGWEQGLFQDTAINAQQLHVAQASPEFKKGDGCFLYTRHVIKVNGTMVSGAGPPRILSDEYFVHFECISFESFYAKVLLMRSYMLWFANPEQYEETTEKYLRVENAALYKWSREVPETFEARELAHAIGIAIALGRALIMPFSRCVQTLGSHEKYYWPPFDIDAENATDFPVSGASAALNMQRFCFPEEVGGQATLVEKYLLPKYATERWAGQYLSKSLYLIDEEVVHLREPTFPFNPRVKQESIASSPHFVGMTLDAKLKKLDRSKELRSHLQTVVETAADLEAQNSTEPFSEEQSLVCGELIVDEVNRLGEKESPVIELASAHAFGGFVAGSANDQKYKRALELLNGMAFHRTCA